jgi:tetratricopeptide (TPR) repeat protein
LLVQKPGDVALMAALSNVLLHQEKFLEANDLLVKASNTNSDSAVLFTALGFVQSRSGTPWTAAQSAARAIAFDPCNARARLLYSKLLNLSSMHKSAAAQLQVAHAIDPVDPEIREEWMTGRPLKERIKDAEEFLNGRNGLDPDEQKRWRSYLDHLKKVSEQPPRPCQRVSKETSTEWPFAFLMQDATHLKAFGLDVKLNSRPGRLQVDTGLGGLTVSPGFAKRAGLEPFSQDSIGGIGDEGEQSPYTALVDTIRVGSLEFHNCFVEVLKSRIFSPGDDGLIGMNVFSDMLVTLDYPMRKILLGPLPSRPDDVGAGKPTTLATDED